MRLPLFSRQLWLSGATRRNFKFSGGIKQWVQTGSWTVNPGITKKRASLTLHAIEDFTDASIYDALRFAIAAFESARAVPPHGSDARNYAWQFITYYYAGYFAANSLMRICGYACTYFSISECSEINEQALMYGIGGTNEQTKIAPGVFYAHTINTGIPTLDISAVNTKGGVHIQFWVGFLKFLEVLNGSIKISALPSSDRTAAAAELNDLIAGLKHSGVQTGAWLSEVRNAINYRLEYGAWFPYEDNSLASLDLERLFKGSLDENLQLPKPAQSIPDPARAARLSAFLLSWLRASLTTLKGTSAGKKKDLIVKESLNK